MYFYALEYFIVIVIHPRWECISERSRAPPGRDVAPAGIAVFCENGVKGRGENSAVRVDPPILAQHFSIPDGGAAGATGSRDRI